MADDPVQGTGGDARSSEAPPASVDELAAVVYRELRAIARRERLRLSGGDTLTTTALIHELYLRFADPLGLRRDSGDFLRVAAVAMRRMLVDRVRAQLAAKRGGGAAHVDAERAADFVVRDDETVLAVHRRSLGRLGTLEPRPPPRSSSAASSPATASPRPAEALGLSERTVPASLGHGAGVAQEGAVAVVRRGRAGRLSRARLGNAAAPRDTPALRLPSPRGMRRLARS